MDKRRSKFIGSHVTEDIYESLRKEADKLNMSVSALVFVILENALKGRKIRLQRAIEKEFREVICE